MPLNVGIDGQSFLLGLSGVHILYLVFCLRDESSWHDDHESKFLEFGSVRRQFVYGSIVGLVFRSRGGKARQADGKTSFCLVSDLFVRNTVVDRESNRE